jgi:hypothetical protein
MRRESEGRVMELIWHVIKKMVYAFPLHIRLFSND